MRRHFAKLDAALVYAHCPMRYAYKYLLGKGEGPSSSSCLLELKVSRTMKSMAREKLRTGHISSAKTSMLWQLAVHDTVIATTPKLNSKGRHLVHTFGTWLTSANVVGMSVPRAIPVQIGPKEVLELRTTADLVVGSSLYRLAPHNWLESAILATDTAKWHIFDTRLGCWKKATTKSWLSGILKQIARGMFRSIAWPYKDSRCNRCEFKKVCTPKDVALLRSGNNEGN